MNHSRASYLFCFAALLLSGVLLLQPQTHFQNVLSQGDHGLNLYAIQAVNRGEMPYKDFVWYYGPGMLYYYAAFFKIFGASIQSVLLGKAILLLGSGITLYLTLNLFLHPLLSLTGALWFWIFYKNFPHTYNHEGGILLLCIVGFLTLLYLKNQDKRFLYANGLALFFLYLVKPNIGLAAAAGMAAGMIIPNLAPKKIPPFKHWVACLSCVALPSVLALGIYWRHLGNFPLEQIKRSVPVFADHASTAPLQVIATNILLNGMDLCRNIQSSWTHVAVCLLILGAALKIIVDFQKGKVPISRRQEIIFTLGIITLFYLLALHENIMVGSFYEKYWADPFKVLLMFLVIGLAVEGLPRRTMGLLCAGILGIALIQAQKDYTTLAQLQEPHSRFSVSGTDIIVNNTPDWISTVTGATEFLKTNLKPDELFWAVPYDALYYFLTDKKSPTRELMLFQPADISSEKERSIIAQMETKKVNWVLLSNRVSSKDGLGEMGRDYCPLLTDYISAHFVRVAQFGEWSPDPGWWWNHGVKILKRTSP